MQKYTFFLHLQHFFKKYLKKIFNPEHPYPLSTQLFHYQYSQQQYFLLYLVAILGSTEIPKLCLKKSQEYKVVKGILMIARPVVLAGALLVVTAFLVDGSFNPFLYFRF